MIGREFRGKEFATNETRLSSACLFVKGMIEKLKPNEVHRAFLFVAPKGINRFWRQSFFVHPTRPLSLSAFRK